MNNINKRKHGVSKLGLFLIIVVWDPGQFFIHKAAIKNAKNINIDEIIFYLKSRYSTDIGNQITSIQDIPNQKDVPSFEQYVIT